MSGAGTIPLRKRLNHRPHCGVAGLLGRPDVAQRNTRARAPDWRITAARPTPASLAVVSIPARAE